MTSDRLPVRSIHRDDGSVLLYLVVAMVAVGALGAGMIGLQVSSSHTLLTANSSNRAQFLAESGLRFAQARFCAEGSWSEPQTITLLSGEILLIEPLPANAGFAVTAIIFPGTPLEARAKVFGTLPDCEEAPPPIPGETPDDYVVYTGGTGGSGFLLPSGATVEGSIFGYSVNTSPGSEITENVISTTSVSLHPRTVVGGYVCAANGYVHTQPNAIIGGNIYAFGNVTLSGGTTVMGSIFATGNVELQNSDVHVGGDVHAGGSVSVVSGRVQGNIRSGWNVTLSGSQIGGRVDAGNNIILGGGSTIGGNSFAGGSRNDHNPGSVFRSAPPRRLPESPAGCPPPPPPPQMQTFSAGTVPPPSLNPIPPGVYGNLSVSGNTIVTLRAGNCAVVNGSGCYVFNTFQPGNILRLDLSTGPSIGVFVAGQINFTGQVQVSTDGINYTAIDALPAETAKTLARRVYFETHSTLTVGNHSTWMGTVLSRNGISVGTHFFAVGGFATVAGPISIGSNPLIRFVIADFAQEHWLP